MRRAGLVEVGAVGKGEKRKGRKGENRRGEGLTLQVRSQTSEVVHSLLA